MTEPGFTHDSPGTPAAAWRADARWASMPPAELPQGVDHLLVVAAHPDDETLGAGALVRHASDAGRSVDVVVATCGEASHPDSPTHTPERLAQVRAAEVHQAVTLLAPAARLHLTGLPDGTLTTHEPELAEALEPLVTPATLVVSPWTGDGHPDHAAAHVVARHPGAQHWQYPIWFWHWGTPDVAPWAHLVRRPVPAAERQARAQAAAHHVSQVAPLSDAPGDEVLLAPALLEHFADDEVFVVGHEEEPLRATFEPLHEDHPDPWGTRTRWYEERKRGVLLAALTRPRYGRALEVGCSVGTLTAALAERCDQVLALDGAQAAIEEARTHVTAPHVTFRTGPAPDAVPAETFDLVVLSEVGYFLTPMELAATLHRAEQALADDGELVLCHWRHEIEGFPLDGPDVHAMAARRLTLERVARYEDADFELDLYARPGRPGVAAREGLA